MRISEVDQKLAVTPHSGAVEGKKYPKVTHDGSNQNSIFHEMRISEVDEKSGFVPSRDANSKILDAYKSSTCKLIFSKILMSKSTK